ncbi:hypothetical protein [Arthrobacter sp. G119Y2]|uniref:hypothetical protein n=1 Tax=Arthrobacter sp. G119Y2 TaxID=3134965 RepID=UPI00311982B1
MSARDELARDLKSIEATQTSLEHTLSFHAWTAEALIAKGYRKPRTITTVEELDALPRGSVIRDGDEELMEKTDIGWCCWVYLEGFLSSELALPATVIHEPETEATR